MNVALIGAGHIAASIIRSAETHGLSSRFSVFDIDANVRARAKEIGLGHVVDDPRDAVRDADLVILAVPAGAMGAAYASIEAALKPGAVLSDVGSVKRAVIAAITPRSDIFFVPAHPLAGTERSGPDAGVAGLFDNRWLIITPLDDPRPDYAGAVRQLGDFWQALGARVETMSPERHDVVLAVVSHLPHLIAFNIVAMAEDLETVTENEVVKYSASGFRDFTRIAASDPVMWRDVFLANKEAVLEILGRFSEDLAVLQRAIRWGDGTALHDTFARARRVRREVIDAGQDVGDVNWGRDKPKPQD